MTEDTFFSHHLDGGFEPKPWFTHAKLAQQLSLAGRDILSLASAEPDFRIPDQIMSAGQAALENDNTKITDVDGTPRLKKAISEKFKIENNIDYQTNQISVSSGVRQILSNVMQATIRSGDEVIIPSPYWPSQKDIVDFYGAHSVVIGSNIGDGFKLRPEILEQAITEQTKWVFIDNPGIVSGSVYSKNELVEIGEVLRRYPHVWAINDNTYEHFLYDKKVKCSTFVEANPDLITRTLTLNSVGLAYNISGCGVAYCGGPRKLIDAMRVIQSLNGPSPSSLDQALALAAIRGPNDFMSHRIQIFSDRLSIAKSIFDQSPGLVCSRPDSAFYLLVNCEGLMGEVPSIASHNIFSRYGSSSKPQGGLKVKSTIEFAQYLVEKEGVVILPGEALGMPNYIRVSLASSTEAVREGCDRIKSACLKLTNG